MNQGKFNALLAELERTNELLAQLVAVLAPAKPSPAKRKAKPKAKAKVGDGVKVA